VSTVASSLQGVHERGEQTTSARCRQHRGLMCGRVCVKGGGRGGRQKMHLKGDPKPLGHKTRGCTTPAAAPSFTLHCSSSLHWLCRIGSVSHQCSKGPASKPFALNAVADADKHVMGPWVSVYSLPCSKAQMVSTSGSQHTAGPCIGNAAIRKMLSHVDTTAHNKTKIATTTWAKLHIWRLRPPAEPPNQALSWFAGKSQASFTKLQPGRYLNTGIEGAPVACTMTMS
jgi:hypothetical protein